MSILLLSFSGRKEPGNCMKILEFLKGELIEKGLDCSLLNVVDLNIRPCLGCNYECFSKEPHCPINDDVDYVYKKIMGSNKVIMCVPVYSSAPPSTYFSLRERSQSIFRTNEIFQRYENVKKLYIVIGKKISGATQTIDILLDDDKTVTMDDILLLESSEYGQKSIEGKLIECREVKNKIQAFLTTHITNN